MAFKILPTVRIEDPNKPGDYVVINFEDYDPEVHELWEDDVQEAPATEEILSPSVESDDDEPLPAPEPTDPVFGSAEAQALAREHGIPIGDLVGTGKDGGILVRDVRLAIKNAS